MARVITTNPFDLLQDENEDRSNVPNKQQKEKPATPKQGAAKPAASKPAAAAAKPAAAGGSPKPAPAGGAKPAAPKADQKGMCVVFSKVLKE